MQHKNASWCLALSVGLALGGCSTGAVSGGASGPGQAAESAAPSPRDAVAKAALVIDVRTSQEFSTGHLERAENIPVDEIEAKVDAITAQVAGDKTKSIVLYCGSGARAGRAKATLEKAGFTNVTNAGGYKDLKD